jgi:hypothetical protein
LFPDVWAEKTLDRRRDKTISVPLECWKPPVWGKR